MRCPSCAGEIPQWLDQCPSCAGLSSTTPLLLDVERAQRSPVESPTAEPKDGRAFSAGQVVAGRYQIVRRVGRGGMGDVYQAEDLKLGQTVALKFLLPERRHDRLRLELLWNEVRLARQVLHPNVCRVYDVTEADGLHFLSMEYIDGENLTQLMKRIGRLREDRALVLSLELCSGLEAAHQRGILHRDLKPANLMLDATGHLRITDFGLAWLYRSPGGGAASPVRGGTPGYVAPELRAGGDATVASDLYALGLVLYELFTGRRPGAERPEPPSKWVPELDPELDWVLLSCLEHDPRSRPSSAGEVGAVFEQKIVPPWHPQPGAVVPQRRSWKLASKLSSGAAGDAWLAVHRQSGDQRVFKFCREPRFLSALKREITLFRLLKEELGERDDIARILDWSFDEPPWFIESEFTEGGDLLTWAAGRGGLGRVALDERLEIVAQVATALAAAHSIGVLHKDVKPANILIQEDPSGRPQARLADFGIGAFLEAERLERAGITALGFTAHLVDDRASYAGTRLYTAPELLEGKPATLQADVYALGVVLYQMVVGDLARALASGWQRDVADPLLVEEIAAAVDGVPERRLGNTMRLAENLRTLPARRARREAEERLRQAEEASMARSRRRRRVLLAALATALLVALGSLYWADRAQQERDRAQDMTRVAAAGDWLRKDPTRAALLLLEVEAAHETPYFASRVREALRQELALLELRGHEAFIRIAAWNRAADRILTASYDGAARVWDASSGRPLAVLAQHGGSVMYAAWNRDGTRIATASSDHTARLWDLARPASSLELRGHEEYVMWVAWSHDGSRVATMSKDRTARIWDAAAGRPLHELRGHTGTVWMGVWNAEDTLLLTTSLDATARIWSIGELEGPVNARVLAGHEDMVWFGEWSPDERRVVTASADGTARVWQVEAGSSAEPVVLAGHGGGVWRATWSPDGRWIATASEDHTVRIWPAAGDAEPTVLEGHEDDVWSVAWSPDGTRLLSTSKDATARVWSIDDGGVVVLRGHGGHIEFGTWSPDGRFAVTTSTDSTARVWKPGSAGAEIVLENRQGAVHSLAWDGDDRILAVAEGGAALWPADGVGEPAVVEAADVPREWRHRRPLGVGSWSPDRRWKATAQGATVLVSATSPGDQDPASARADPLPPRRLQGHRDRVHAAAWSRGGERLATVGWDGTARIWDVGTLSELRRFEQIVPMISVAWSAGERFLLTGLTDGRTLVWELGGADRPPIVLQGLGLRVNGIVFSPGGERLATATDNLIQIWSFEAVRRSSELASDAQRIVRPKAVLESHAGGVEAVAWSPDGRRLASAALDGTTRIWRLDTGELRRLLAEATRVCLDPEFRQVELGTSVQEAERRYEECEKRMGRR